MIVAGFGFRGAATVDSLRGALAAAGGGTPAVLAAPSDKCAASVFTAFAAALGLPIMPVDDTSLTAADTVTQSIRVKAKRGTGSVAEAAALAAAGPAGRLLGPRAVSPDRMATCAFAERPDT